MNPVLTIEALSEARPPRAPEVESVIAELRQQKQELLDMIEEGLTGWCSQTFERVLAALKAEGRDVADVDDAEFAPSADEPHLNTPTVDSDRLRALSGRPTTSEEKTTNDVKLAPEVLEAAETVLRELGQGGQREDDATWAERIARETSEFGD